MKQEAIQNSKHVAILSEEQELYAIPSEEKYIPTRNIF